MTNLYDFDHTIYKGDASFDFIKYCIARHPKLWYLFFVYCFVAIQYILGLKSRKQVKEVAFSFLPKMHNIDFEVEGFWDIYEKKIANWYQNRQIPSDVIISASPDFLLRPIATRLGVAEVIATRMSKDTGIIDGENCRGKEKVSRLKLLGIHEDIGDVYSDSQSDMPIFLLAKGSAYIVKGSNITPWKELPSSRLSTMRSVKFIRFVLVGGINATLGVCFSYILLPVVDNPQLAFVVGFFMSLCVAYFLNSVIVFRDNNFSYKKFLAFVISYLPNFIIQFTSVYVFVTILHLSPLIAYIMAVLVAVPITFLLLSGIVFSNTKNVK